MKILVTAKYVNGTAREGGSGRFMKCVIDTLQAMGHEVVATSDPRPLAAEALISHGRIGDEVFLEGADRYVAVSEEVRTSNRFDSGIDSEVIGQPIEIRPIRPPGQTLRRILVIRRGEVDYDPFAFLAGEYDLRYSDPERPIEDQIAEADLVIALGRGALEAMAQGKPVIVADNRKYMGGAYGDGYLTEAVLHESARCNFSGRRFSIPVTREWLRKELAQYDPGDSERLHHYVSAHHEAHRIVKHYIDPAPRIRLAFGCLVNDLMRLDMVLRQSEIGGTIRTIKNPETACKGLNKLLGILEDEGADVAVLAHQDMYFRSGWIEQVKAQIAKLPESWIVAGIIGKDMEGAICGRVHDMRIPLHFSTSHVFPHPASCFDECCILVNLKKGFRFLEEMPGFDLYGTLCVLQAQEMGGTAWMLDAFAEHYCMRPFSWYPDKQFEACFKWLHNRFPNAKRIDSTVIGVEHKKKIAAQA